MIPTELLRDGFRAPVSSVLPLLDRIQQLNWIDVYLLSPDKAASAFKYARRRYPELLPSVDFLVRAIDSSYFYVFSMTHPVDEVRHLRLPWAFVDVVDPEQFTFPD